MVSTKHRNSIMITIRKLILCVAIAFTTFVSYSQTQPNLPTGSKAYSGNLFLDLSGNVWTGKAGSYTNLGTKAKVDSVLALKVNIADIQDVLRAGDDVSELANDAGYITLADLPAQVQSDWLATSGAAAILNKPDLSVYALKGEIPTSTSDLTNDGDGTNPFITSADVQPQVPSDWNATTGVSRILNKPAIPSKTSDLTNDGEDGVNKFITEADLAGTGKASVLNLNNSLTVNWQTGVATDETGAPTTETWAQRFGNNVSMLRLYNDNGTWRDESLQIAVTYTGNNITTVRFPNVFGDTKIIIIASGASGAPTGIFINKGDWASATYSRSDYVVAASTANPAEKSLYFLIGNDDYASTTAPRLDLDHWSEIPAVKGDKGDTGERGIQGEQGIQGPPGVGVPTGGTIGQILTKVNSTNYNTTWADAPTLTEVDPTVPAHVKAITSTNISNWNTAFGWGNHAAAGYAVLGTAAGQVRNNTQLDARYLQSFTETDPTVSAWAKASTKPTYTFAELTAKPTTVSGYGITDAAINGTGGTQVRNNTQMDARYVQPSALGTAASKNTGTAVGNVVEVQPGGKIDPSLYDSGGGYDSIVSINNHTITIINTYNNKAVINEALPNGGGYTLNFVNDSSIPVGFKCIIYFPYMVGLTYGDPPPGSFAKIEFQNANQQPTPTVSVLNGLNYLSGQGVGAKSVVELMKVGANQWILR